MCYCGVQWGHGDRNDCKKVSLDFEWGLGDGRRQRTMTKTWPATSKLIMGPMNKQVVATYIVGVSNNHSHNMFISWPYRLCSLTMWRRKHIRLTRKHIHWNVLDTYLCVINNIKIYLSHLTTHNLTNKGFTWFSNSFCYRKLTMNCTFHKIRSVQNRVLFFPVNTASGSISLQV